LEKRDFTSKLKQTNYVLLAKIIKNFAHHENPILFRSIFLT